MYEVDRKSGFVHDYTQYRMYLSRESNSWEKAYSMRSFYKVEDGSDYEGFRRFLTKMRDDGATYKKSMIMNRSEGPDIIKRFQTGEWWLYQQFYFCYFGSSVFEQTMKCTDGHPCKVR